MSEWDTYDTFSEGKHNGNCAYIELSPPLLLLLLLCVAVLLLLQLLLFVMVCRVAKSLLWFTESDSSVFSLSIQSRMIFYVPLGSAVAFTVSICLLQYQVVHFGQLRSSAEPRPRQPAAAKPPL